MNKLRHMILVLVLVCFWAGCAGDNTPLDARDTSRSDSGAGIDAGDIGAGGDGSSPTGPGVRDCESNSDCEAPQVCAVTRRGEGLELSCKNPRAGTGDLGDACVEDVECASTLCLDGECSRACARPADCSDDGTYRCESSDVSTDTTRFGEINACRPRPASECSSDADCSSGSRCQAKKTETNIRFECGPSSGGAEIGESCAADGDCAQNLCLDGICSGPCASTGDCSAGAHFTCTLGTIDLGSNQRATGQICSPPRECTSERECRVGETCRIDRTTGIAYCSDPAGDGKLGDICEQDRDCAQNLCLADRYRDICTQTCDRDSDCTRQGYECKNPEIDDGEDGTHAMKVCVLKTPPSCTSKNSCGTGTTCAVVKDPTSGDLDRACLPTVGKENGQRCANNDECASQVCEGRVCSSPCTDHDQCAGQQLCLETAVELGGSSASFDMCVTPPDVRCDQTHECHDDVRVCNRLVRSSSNEYEAYCGMPSSSGDKGLGEACSASAECGSNLCLEGVSDECSISCTSDSQCSSGSERSCVELLPGRNGETVSLCMAACGRNADCEYLSGNGYEHTCDLVFNVKEDRIDQFCSRRRETDDDGNTLGRKGADCEGSGGNSNPSVCQTGLCIQMTIGGDIDHQCTRLCTSDADCQGGEPGNDLSTCSSEVSVELPSGATGTISMCSRS